ncbi:MAG TPA: SDR family oxidoreductase [Candidatus Sericytochromatia bacterium]
MGTLLPEAFLVKKGVNSLNPGLVATEGLHTQGVLEGDFYDMALKNTLLGRAGQPEAIGLLAVFLVSDDSYRLTGQRLLASGGQT